ncbi:MAG: 16S rRNA (guanine(966)-N(2))-methyltransferase RsmD [bacterium]|nr:16S rRNA (guanine(966)-N(2))-methyltransferase RsmD [bacterium]
MLRPTQNKVKQAIFNIFQSEIVDADFLDLFAGKGTIGFEALSKGARHVILVDNQPAVRASRRNTVTPLQEQKIEIIKQDVFLAIEKLFRNGSKFDFIFADPPYHENQYEKLLTGLVKYDILKKSGFLILEHYWKEVLPEENNVFKLWKKKKYGDTVLSIYQKKEE